MKRNIFTSLTAAGLLACTIATASAAPATDCPMPAEDCRFTAADLSSAEQISSLELAACTLINRQREAYGLSALSVDADLSAMARIKSQDMKINRYFSHTSPAYGTPFQMMQQLGIRYRFAGENIARGYAAAEDVVRAWMASETHRANILSDQFTTMGIGYADGYWTQWLIG